MQDLPRVTTKKTPKNNFWVHVFGFQYNLESILRAFKRKEMKSSRRLAENDIITRGVTVKMQQMTMRGNYENPSNDAKGEDE